MRTTTIKNLATVFVVLIVGIMLVALTNKSSRGQTKTGRAIGTSPGISSAAGEIKSNLHPNELHAVAPFILTDTVTDSPGTNLATRLVKFAAEVGGTTPLFKQWKVDKGRGFVDVSTGATNATLWITNAQVSDSGLYALFATNSAGITNTAPQPLIVIEGAD